MYLIQTRVERNMRSGSDIAREIVDGSTDPRDWSNYSHEYIHLTKAKKEAVSMIEGGVYKARNVRIVEVVCTFTAEVTVKEAER